MQEHVQVESSKCKACRRCEVACIAAHHGMDFKTAMKQRAAYSPRVWAVKGEDFKTSVRCHQCQPAPCCHICPTGALQQEADGRIVMYTELCAGCKMCIFVCPYGCVTLESIKQPEEVATKTDERKVAVRCDLCREWRAEKGVDFTACMEACMTRALSLVTADGNVIEAPKPEKKPVAKAVAGATTDA